MQVGFGAGILWGTQLTDVNGAVVANASPIQFGALQEGSVDFEFDTKLLYGSNQFPLFAARGKGKITGKAKSAQVNGALLNAIMFGQTLSSGITADVYDAVGTAIPAGPSTITPTVPGTGTWSVDLGVRDTNNLALKKVAATPTAGQYSVSGGVYTFATADVGKTVYINFQYTATSTIATKIPLTNVLMGAAPTFRADLSIPFNGKSLTVTLLNCLSSKLSLATKLDDFLIPDFEFSAFADASGTNIGYIALSE